MTTASYHLLDVFTDTRFAGNQLAVFLEADELDTASMQSIAHELNLAETVFLGAASAANHYPMRIFTPTEELAFASHPTVGTAWLLNELGMVERTRPLTLELPVGKLAVEFIEGKATFTTARPAQVSESMLDAASEWARSVVSSGVEQVYLYVIEAVKGESATLKSRMFSMHDSLCEDPATGSAAAALTGYLAAQGETRQCVTHQGVEMGRPSVIETAMAGERVRVGGRAVRVRRGEFYLRAIET